MPKWLPMVKEFRYFSFCFNDCLKITELKFLDFSTLTKFFHCKTVSTTLGVSLRLLFYLILGSFVFCITSLHRQEKFIEKERNTEKITSLWHSWRQFLGISRVALINKSSLKTQAKTERINLNHISVRHIEEDCGDSYERSLACGLGQVYRIKVSWAMSQSMWSNRHQFTVSQQEIL